MNYADVQLSRHVLDRYRIFYPTAGWSEVRSALEKGFEIDPRSAWAVTGRAARGIPLKKGTVFIMHQDRTGLFAVEKYDKIVVTFLRFNDYQQERVLKLWPLQKPAPEVPKNIGIPDYMKDSTTEDKVNPFESTVSFEPEDPVVVVKASQSRGDQLREVLPGLGVRTNDIRVSKKLLADHPSDEPLREIRKAIYLAKGTIRQVTTNSYTIRVGGQGLVLSRRPDYEKNEPEWWLSYKAPPPVSRVEAQMAEMLRRRGWVVMAPSLEV